MNECIANVITCIFFSILMDMGYFYVDSFTMPYNSCNWLLMLECTAGSEVYSINQIVVNSNLEVF